MSGALISLLRDGASKVIKQTRSDAAGRFSTRISPGRYGIRAIAAGFNEVVFSSVEVRASQELVYRFNLEPIGSGKTFARTPQGPRRREVDFAFGTNPPFNLPGTRGARIATFRRFSDRKHRPTVRLELMGPRQRVVRRPQKDSTPGAGSCRNILCEQLLWFQLSGS